MSAPGDIYEMAVTSLDTTSTYRMVNVFHFRAVTGGCTATSLIADWRTNIEATWRAMIPSQTTIERYLAFNLIPYSTDTAEQRVTVVGTNGSTGLPMLCAGIITWRTAQMGRRYRGRTYFGNVATADSVGGTLVAAAISGKWNPLGTAILNRYGATGTSTDTRIVVWSRVLGNQTPPHNAAGATQITSYTVQRALGSMGTRRFGRGI